MAHLAPSLVTLRNEINAKWPNRDKSSDGWIGDVAHASRRSEHNPDDKGCVHALDVDKDGIDPQLLLRELIGDPRVWYVIFRGVIYSRTHGFQPRRYTGANRHDHHIHVSIQLTDAAEADTRRWFGGPAPVDGVRPTVVHGDSATSENARPNPPTRPSLRLASLGPGKRGAEVLVVQKALAKFVGLDYSSGPGVWGPRTQAAYDQARRKMGYRGDDATGAVGRESLKKLGAKYGFDVV